MSTTVASCLVSLGERFEVLLAAWDESRSSAREGDDCILYDADLRIWVNFQKPYRMPYYRILSEMNIGSAVIGVGRLQKNARYQFGPKRSALKIMSGLDGGFPARYSATSFDTRHVQERQFSLGTAKPRHYSYSNGRQHNTSFTQRALDVLLKVMAENEDALIRSDGPYSTGNCDIRPTVPLPLPGFAGTFTYTATRPRVFGARRAPSIKHSERI